jgi:ligand-binding SRPBCC domain-containing protein
MRTPDGSYVLERTQVVPRPIDETFAFFADPSNLEQITPPWLRFRIVEAPHRLERGATLRYRLRIFGWPIRWRTVIAEWRPPRTFTDVQTAGPYPLWEHTHRLNPLGDRTQVYDHVRYDVPVPLLSARIVRLWLDEIFDYRAERLAELLGGPL